MKKIAVELKKKRKMLVGAAGVYKLSACPVDCDAQCEAEKARLLKLEEEKLQQEEALRQQEFDAMQARERAATLALDAQQAATDAKLATDHALALAVEAARDDKRKAEAAEALRVAERKTAQGNQLYDESLRLSKQAQDKLMELNAARSEFMGQCRHQNNEQLRFIAGELRKCNLEKVQNERRAEQRLTQCQNAIIEMDTARAEVQSRIEAEIDNRRRRREEEEERWSAEKQKREEEARAQEAAEREAQRQESERFPMTEFWRKEARLIAAQIFEEGDILGDPSKEGFYLTLLPSGDIQGTYRGYREDGKLVNFPAQFTTNPFVAGLGVGTVDNTRPKQMYIDTINPGTLLVTYQDDKVIWAWHGKTPISSPYRYDFMLNTTTGEVALRALVALDKRQVTGKMQLQTVGSNPPLRDDEEVIYSIDKRTMWKIDRINPGVVARRAFQNNEAVRQNGFDPNNPMLVPSRALLAYPLGKTITALPLPLRNGGNYECNGTVYRIEKAKKRPYANLAAFQRDNKPSRIDEPRPACELLSLVPPGQPIT